MADHADRALRVLDQVPGDYITRDGTSAVLAYLLEAQVHAILAVAEALRGIHAHLEEHVICVRDADRL